MPAPLTDGAPVYPLRLPMDLDRQVRTWAKNHNMSLAKSISFLLRVALLCERDGYLDVPVGPESA